MEKVTKKFYLKSENEASKTYSSTIYFFKGLTDLKEVVRNALHTIGTEICEKSNNITTHYLEIAGGIIKLRYHQLRYICEDSTESDYKIAVEILNTEPNHISILESLENKFIKKRKMDEMFRKLRERNNIKEIYEINRLAKELEELSQQWLPLPQEQ